MSLFYSSSVNYHSNTRTTIEYNDSNYSRALTVDHDHDEDFNFTENYYFQPINNEPVVTSDAITANDSITVTDTRGDDLEDSIEEDIEDIEMTPDELKQLLIDVVGAFEQDPISRRKFMRKLRRRGNYNARSISRRNILRTMQAIVKDQDNPFAEVPVGEDQVTFFYSMTQSCKTGSIIYYMWKAGITKSKPSVLLSYNRCGEEARFADSGNSFNNLVMDCAELIGLDKNMVPVVSIIDQTGSDDYITKVKDMHSNRDTIIGEDGSGYAVPVMVVLTNYQKITNLVQRVIKEISFEVGLEEESSAMNALLVIDEAELAIKSATGDNSKLERAMAGTVSLTKKLPLGPHNLPTDTPSSRACSVEGIYNAFSSRVHVTATPHAFAIVDPRDSVYIPQVITATPSVNYWAFAKRTDWRCKTITPVVAESSAKMVDEMLKPNLGNRQALVMGSSGNDSTFSKAKQQKMASDCARRVAREGLASDSMAFLTIAWEGDKITVFTSNQYLKEKLEKTGSFSHSTPFPVNNDNPVVVSRFESKGGRGKETELDEEGVVRVNHSNIRSYPVLMSLLNELKEDDCFFPAEIKTVLYSYKMSERSTPIKAQIGHEFPLTDMYVKILSHDEGIIQGAGRLCGIDNRKQSLGKFVWGTIDSLTKLYDAVKQVPYYIDKIAHGENMTELSKKVAISTGSKRNGECFHDSDGVVGRSSVNRTRPGLCGTIKSDEKRIKDNIRTKRLRVDAPSYDHGYSSLPDLSSFGSGSGGVSGSSQGRTVNDRLLDLFLNNGGTLSKQDMRRLDPDLCDILCKRHWKVLNQMVRDQIIERVSTGVYKVIGA